MSVCSRNEGEIGPTTATSDLARHPHRLFSFEGAKVLGSMNMEDLLQNIYAADSPRPPIASDPVGKSVDEVWKEISQENRENTEIAENAEIAMTLEDYLARAGIVGEEIMQPPPLPPLERKSEAAFPVFDGEGVNGGGRGRRRIVNDQMDKVSQQRQRRMIKNRESAARSRERKQKYTVELESLVAQLEEENSALQSQLEEQRRKRLKELVETRIPVTEREKTQRQLRRTSSMKW